MTTEQRLERLERENRRMRRIGAVAVAVAAAVFLVGQGKSKELPDLEARSLTIKDEGGNVRAKLTTAGAAAGLALMAKDGKVRVNLYTTAGGSTYLRFFDKDEKMRAACHACP